MNEKLDISRMPPPPADQNAIARDWSHDDSGRLLPGEEGGYTVYGVEFWDGCSFFDYTQGSVFERVSELGFGPVEVWRENFLSEHMGQMAYVVRCVTSDLTVTDALELVTRLVVAAPRGMELRGRGVLECRECFLGEHALEPVTMSFGEWVKTRKAAETGDIQDETSLNGKGRAWRTITRRKSMKSPEERRAEDRRRRTERQRERRSQDRICGYCREPATAGLIEWFGRGRPLLIPICRSCLTRLGARCRDMDEVGPWCHLDEQRPCADCSVASPAEKSERSFLRRLFSG